MASHEIVQNVEDHDAEHDVAGTLGLGARARGARRLARWLALGVVALTGAVVVVWLDSDRSARLQYRTEPVVRGSLTVTVSATGNLDPINQVDVGSELSGIIETVHVDDNDLVRQGQALAKLDTDLLAAEVLQSKAALESARARVLDAEATIVEARLTMERARELVAEELSSQSELDAADAAFKRAEADLASARAQVSQAEATLNARETSLHKATIRSPIDGVVLDRNVEPGQTVAASLQAPVLFTLAESLTQMELRVDVDEADVGQVEEGQAASFMVDAHPNRTFPARITRVRYGSQEVDGVITYEAVLKVDNSDLSLRPGMTATADIVVEKVENAVLISNQALRFEPPTQQEGETPSGGGSLIGQLMPRPPGRRPTQRDDTAAEIKEQRVWMLRNGKMIAVALTTGATDGIRTEVVAGELEPAMELVVETVDPER